MIENEDYYHEPEIEFESAPAVVDLVKTPGTCWVSDKSRIRCAHYPDAVVGVLPHPNAQVTRAVVSGTRLAVDAEIILPEQRRASMPYTPGALETKEWRDKLHLGRSIPEGFLYSYPWSNNYHHFLHELFPRLLVYFVLEKERPGLPIILGWPFSSYHLESLQLFGLGDRVVFVPWEMTLKVSSLFIGSSPIATVLNPTPLFYDFVSVVRSKLQGPIYPHTKRLYISRRFSTHGAGQERVLVNESELVAKLEGLGFVEIVLERYSLEEKLSLFAHADFVCGPFGSGLATAPFMKEGSTLLIFDHPVFTGEWYTMVTEPRHVWCRHVQLGEVDSTHPQPDTPHKRWRIDVEGACREVEQLDRAAHESSMLSRSILA